MLVPAANDNYRQPARAERIENAILQAIGVPFSAVFWGVLAYSLWHVLVG
jgi:hypothetical protein